MADPVLYLVLVGSAGRAGERGEQLCVSCLVVERPQDLRVDAAGSREACRSASVSSRTPPGCRAWGSSSDTNAGRTHIVAAPPSRRSVSTATNALGVSPSWLVLAGMGSALPCSSARSAVRPDTSSTLPVNSSTPRRSENCDRADAVSRPSRVSAPPVSASTSAGFGSMSGLSTSQWATNCAER